MNPVNETEHNEVMELLPWYATQRIKASDSVRIESHLAGCIECDKELQFLRRLDEGIASAKPAQAWTPSAVHFSTILDEIELQEKETPLAQPAKKAAAKRNKGFSLFKAIPNPLLWLVSLENRRACGVGVGCGGTALSRGRADRIPNVVECQTAGSIQFAHLAGGFCGRHDPARVTSLAAPTARPNHRRPNPDGCLYHPLGTG